MKRRKIMALALAAALALGMLAGCCEDSSSSGSTEEVTLNTIDDAALTDTIGDVLWENGILDDTKENISCSYENSNTYIEPSLTSWIESWGTEKIDEIIKLGSNEDGSNHLTNDLLPNEDTPYRSLQSENGREDLFDGRQGFTYLDGIVIPSGAEVNDAVNAVADYLENYRDPSGEKSLKDLPDDHNGRPCNYNFAFKVVQVAYNGSKAYVGFIIIDIPETT